jgi:hypothetical protein
MKRKPKPISGLTWNQKLGIESALEYAIAIWDQIEADLPQEFKKQPNGFRKILAIFRKKTKHMHKPRRRKRLA